MAQAKAEMSGLDTGRMLVLDANILLRAVLGVRVRSLIETYSGDVPMFVPAHCVSEVREYLPSLCAKRNWEMAPQNIAGVPTHNIRNIRLPTLDISNECR
jgi:hypothetical protein